MREESFSLDRVVRREIRIGAGSDGAERTQIEERDLASFARALASRAPMDTGLLPPGLAYLRQGGGCQRLVLVAPPAVNTLLWAPQEGGRATYYRVAQPYRVLIGDFVDGTFLGAREFYSPTPIHDLDAPLYHANVPNLNCRGYNGTAVGWVCLYHRDDTTTMSLAERVAYLGQRLSGNEAYNDANMSETDGPRFYSLERRGEVSDPVAWEQRSAKDDALEWATDPSRWIPVLVTGPDSQLKHAKGGVPLTLRMCLDGKAPMYYHDSGERLWHHDPAGLPQEVLRRVFSDAYAHANLVQPFRERVEPTPETPVPPDAPVAVGTSFGDVYKLGAGDVAGAATWVTTTFHPHLGDATPNTAPMFSFSCAMCGKGTPQNEAFLWNNQAHCQECRSQYFATCSECGATKPTGMLAFDDGDEVWYCPEHNDGMIMEEDGATVVCGGCGDEWPAMAPNYFPLLDTCTSCTDYFTCTVCAGVFPFHNSTGPVWRGDLALCQGCDAATFTCSHCQAFTPTGQAIVFDGAAYCPNCLRKCLGCGNLAVLAPGHVLCPPCVVKFQAAQVPKPSAGELLAEAHQLGYPEPSGAPEPDDTF